jgi:hypothetical protein
MPTQITEESNRAEIAWGAIVGGGIAAAALTLLLLAFGAGVGFSVVSPWSETGVSAPIFSLAAGLYLIVVAMIASTVGGYLAGRLRSRWTGVHTDEVYFRDTAHGFLTWAFATVLSAAFLGAATTHIVAGASAGLTQSAGSVATQSAGGASPMEIYTDTLLRPEPSATQSADATAARTEVNRLFTTRFRKGGNLTPADRTYLTQVVAARTGLSQADAEKRVSEVSNQAREAAETARKAAAKLSLWLAAAMLAGAFAGSLAATEGGKLRERNWDDQPAARRGSA